MATLAAAVMISSVKGGNFLAELGRRGGFFVAGFNFHGSLLTLLELNFINKIIIYILSCSFSKFNNIFDLFHFVLKLIEGMNE